MKIDNLFNTNDKEHSKKVIELSSTEEVISLVDFGRKEAIKCNGELEMFNIYLQRIESGHIVKKNEKTDDQLNEIERQKNEITRIESEIESEKEKAVEIKNITIPKLKEKIDLKEDEFNALGSKDPRDVIPTGEKFRPPVFYTLLFFVLALTVSLYYFYVNLGYVLFDLPSIMDPAVAFTCSPTVLNPLSQLMGDGGCQISAGFGSFLLPILFLAIAAVIHMKMERFFAMKQKVKGFLTITFFILLVLVLDVMLAIKFESKLFYWEGSGGIYGDQFPAGIVDQIKYCVDKPAFVLILGLGFMSYLVWSFLIHELSMEYEKKDPEIIWRRRLRALEIEKERLTLKLEPLFEQIEAIIPHKIRDLNKQINRIREKIKLTKIGGAEELKKALLEFATGWNQFIIFKYTPHELNMKTDELKNALKEFLTHSNTFGGNISEEDLQIA